MKNFIYSYQESMMLTESSPLAPSSPSFGAATGIPFYAKDTHKFYSRRRKERQLQCIMFFTILATFIMALIITISYTIYSPSRLVNDIDSKNDEMVINSTAADKILPSNVAEDLFSKEIETLNSLQTVSFPKKDLPQLASSKKTQNFVNNNLDENELQKAIIAGKIAIQARQLADDKTDTLSPYSPSFLHQYAVNTNEISDEIAMVGVAEIAATKEIESVRNSSGKPSSFGNFIKNEWISENICKNEFSRCENLNDEYRTIDGSCNNPENLGMAFTPFARLLKPDYSNGIDSPRTGKSGMKLPSARKISYIVHPPSPSVNSAFTVMLAVFGQFLDHDMTATAISRGTNGSSIACCEPNIDHPECFPVIIEPDMTQGSAESSCMEFVRSAPAAQCKIGPRQQLNQVTSFIDGSQIYGADMKTATALREFSKGYLRMQISPDNRTLLPASDNPNDGCNKDEEILNGRYCFASGDPRANENLHLTTMHLLWARQHNKISNHLSIINPLWSDEKLYQESRRIVGAQLQHITYNEFLPIIIGESEMQKKDLKPLTTGFRLNKYKNVDPTIANSFASAAFRFAHTLLPGLMKMTDDEEGTDSYIHLHKMLFNPYSLYTEAGLKSSIKSAISNFIQKTSTHVTSQLTTHLFEDQSTNKTKPSSCGLDLVSLNIQRGRDHGLPGYIKWREYCNLSIPASFNDLKSILDLESANSLSSLYESVDDIDLYTGALAEIPLRDSLLGPTFTCLISDQFKKLLYGDRFWYEFQNQSGSFTEEQLEQIRKISLAGVICDNADAITEVQKDVMRSVSVINPIVSCQNLSKPSYSAWKMPSLQLKSLFTDVIIGDWLNFKNDINSTLNNIVTNIASKKPPPGSLINDWLIFKQNVNKSFSDFKNQFSDLHKSVLNSTLAQNLGMKSQPLKLIKTNDSLDEIFSKIDQMISVKKIDLSNLPSDWTSYHEKINNSIANIKTFFEKIHTVVPPAQLKTLSSIENIYSGKIYNKSSDTLKKFIISKDNNISSIMDEWFAIKSEIKKNVDDIKKNIFKMKMLELTLCEFFDEGAIEQPVTFECHAFMDNIFKRIFDEINTILPVDENSKSNLNFVKESLSNLKNTLLNFNYERYQSKLFLQLGFDWIQVGDQINSTIENSLNSIPFCQAMKDVNFLDYKKCIKEHFLGIHDGVKNVISDWLIEFKKSFEVSKTATIEKMSINSASTSRSLILNDLLFVISYFLYFVLICMDKL